ncbi:phage tail assembly chaperone [Burkholderia multivorans]|uniref:phage tail assembly chaperone n=1 Tax=Burkholderia multivorans TaxID=87883 RepID=UPI000B5AA3F9|nr:phage tail assembly chaperone [Burkholderia multivorans]MDN7943683.1 phage tail assembly chaperone [Burkholderia multivorans]HEF5152719.1 phage tail protein [Burkholderia multivorans]
MGQKFASYDSNNSIVAFYDAIDSPAPDGVAVVAISDEKWLMLLNAQSLGKRLVIDDAGNPVALEPMPPSRDQRARAKRSQRDAALQATDWLVSRHQDEKLIGDGTTLTAEQFAALLKYRQSLRESSELPGWPNVALPAPPAFIGESSIATD